MLTGRRKDYSGSIRLGETEIKEFPLEELQDNVTVIDQRPFVYQASIRENLTLGQFFPDEEIEQALKKRNSLQLLNNYLSS
ncbi:hypothetical protein ODV97_05575 [Enterococcus gallinarum]|nr:hypothetical protein [Enterococcus gallinarum]